MQPAGDTDLLISFQKCFNLWKIRLHLTILIHRNLIIKLVMRSRGLSPAYYKILCGKTEPDVYVDLELMLISQWNLENFDSKVQN